MFPRIGESAGCCPRAASVFCCSGLAATPAGAPCPKVGETKPSPQPKTMAKFVNPDVHRKAMDSLM
jgi:hypothetical protein